MQAITLSQSSAAQASYRKAIIKKDIAHKVILFVSILTCFVTAINI